MMNNVRGFIGSRGTFFGFVAVALSACAATGGKFDVSSASALDKTEIRERLEGNTLRGTSYTAENPKYADYVIYYPSYGEMKLVSADFRDSGTWRVDDGRYCRTWKEARQSEEECWSYYEGANGEIYWVDQDGVKTDDSVIEAGNADGL